MPNFLNMEVTDLFRYLRNRGAGFETEPLREVASKECAFAFRQNKEEVEVTTDFHPQPLFRLQGKLAGPLGRYQEGLFKLKLETAGRVHTVTATVQMPGEQRPDEDCCLLRAAQSLLPGSTRLLEFVFARAGKEFRYLFEFEQVHQPLGFEPVIDERPVFHQPPPVSQMSAFLRAMARQRRTLAGALRDIVDSSASERALEGFERLQRLHPDFHSLDSSKVNAFIELARLAGKELGRPVVTALALFVDLELDFLLTGEPERLVLSDMAFFTLARFFCLDTGPNDWERHFETSYEECLSKFRRPPYPGVVARLRQGSQGRRHLAILRELAQESKSQRALGFVERAMQKFPDGSLVVNDEQLALRTLLAESGVPVQTNTLTALCLFADIEAGILDADHIEDMKQDELSVDSSLYALVAVAGAFDLELRALELGPGELLALERLVALSRGRVIAVYTAVGEEGHWLEHLTTREDVMAAARGGLEFSGRVLVALPTVDQLNHKDLEVILRAGRPLLARFEGELARALRWRQLSHQPADGQFAFFGEFCRFHFHRQIVGNKRSVSAAELLGGGPRILIDADARGNHHFRFCQGLHDLKQVQQTEIHGLEWSGMELDLPELLGLPTELTELDTDSLLGRRPVLSEEVRLLQGLHRGLVGVLSQPHSYLALTELEKPSDSELEQLLGGVVAPSTWQGLREFFWEQRGYESCCALAPLVEKARHCAVARQYLLLELFLSMGLHSQITLKTYKQLDDTSFEGGLAQRRLALLNDENVELRELGAYLLVTVNGVNDDHDRLVAEYELRRLVDLESDNTVLLRGFEGLVHLGLEPAVPRPQVVRWCLSERERQAEVARSAAERQLEALRDGLERRRQALLREPEVSKLATELATWAGQATRESLRELCQWMDSLATLDDSEQRRYFCLLTSSELARLHRSLEGSWRVFLMQLPELQTVLKLDPGQQFEQWLEFLRGKEDALKENLGELPYLGGVGRPLRLHHLAPGQSLELLRHGDLGNPGDELELNGFYLEVLAFKAVHGGFPEVLKLERAGDTALEELERHLSSFSTERRVYLHHGQRFLKAAGCWGPCYRMADADKDCVVDDEQWSMLERLAAIFDPLSKQGRPQETDEKSPPPTSFGPKEQARRLIELFGLPKSCESQVTRGLLELCKESVYNL